MRKQTIMEFTNRPVQSQKQARSLKFWTSDEERFYYTADIENDILRGCQLSKSNTCIIFTCIKKTDKFNKETGYS